MSYFEKAGEDAFADGDIDAIADQASALFVNKNSQIDQIIELLNLVGIPYILAPFEAEAQCAFLEQKSLVDATATEDSDSLLFGCRKVYRYLFSRQSAPLEFSVRQISADLGLRTDDLITMSLFMGSDYTPGVKGIGAVNAIEIINCFGSEEADLQRFRSWVDINTQIKEQIEKNNSEPEKKETKQEQLLREIEEAMDEEARVRSQTEIEREYLKQHRNLRKYWVFPADFPNFEVINAFKSPNVDNSKESFNWGTPDFSKIKTFAQKQLGWRESEMTKYVDIVEKRVKELGNKRKGTLENYFKRKEVIDTVQSRRVGQAVADLKHKKRKLH